MSGNLTPAINVPVRPQEPAVFPADHFHGISESPAYLIAQAVAFPFPSRHLLDVEQNLGDHTITRAHEPSVERAEHESETPTLEPRERIRETSNSGYAAGERLTLDLDQALRQLFIQGDDGSKGWCIDRGRQYDGS